MLTSDNGIYLILYAAADALMYFMPIDVYKRQLQHDPKLTVRGLIEQSNVAFIGTCL